MEKYRSLDFDDPIELAKPSTAESLLILWIRYLEFARRYYERHNDEKLQRKAMEIRKILHRIADLEKEGMEKYVTLAVMKKFCKIEDKYKKDRIPR